MKVHDESQVEEFLKMIKELSSTKLEIGIFSDGEGGKKHSKDSPITVLGIATVHEFGCRIKVTEKMRNYLRATGLPLKSDTDYINIPERSFIRDGYSDNKDTIIKKTEPLLEQVFNLKLSVDDFFEVLGMYIVGRIQEYLINLKEPPNHPYTIEMKKSSNPLIGKNSQLVNSIDYRVVKH